MPIDDAIFQRFFGGIPLETSNALMAKLEKHQCCSDKPKSMAFYLCECGRTLFLQCSWCDCPLAIVGSDTQPCEHAVAMRQGYAIDDLSY